MLGEAVLLAALQIGPFFERGNDFFALRPVYSRQEETTDVLWPLYSSHRDWWRFCFLFSGQDYPEGGGQFSFLPFWYNGSYPERGDYWGLFPFYGTHPGLATVYDLKFAFWPLWMRYRMPRSGGAGGGYRTSNVFLFPFVSWRDDGSWGVWPLCGVSHNRPGDHRYFLWPFVTWADYRKDRDTSGAGSSWMLWPLFGSVSREREDQSLLLPPFFSVVRSKSHSAGAKDLQCDWRLRVPWPFIELERSARRERISLFPVFERTVRRRYADGEREASDLRFGWRLVELLENETRVFPFWVSNDDGYLRMWPFFERRPMGGGVVASRMLSLFPIRWIPAVDRNWAKFWTFYECESNEVYREHFLLWGLIEWRTFSD